MTVEILALTRYDRLGGSSRVRVLQYIPHLERMGMKITVAPLFRDDDLRRLYREGRRPPSSLAAAFARRMAAVLGRNAARIVWMQQEIFPFLPFLAEAGLLAGKSVVIDYDDANHLYYQTMGSRIARRMYGGKIGRLMKRADAVVAGNPVMMRYAAEAGARSVHLVYSAVDTALFPPQPRPETFTVGWIGTPMTAAQSLHLVREPLARFLARTKAEAYFIGMDEGQFPDLPGRRLAWSEDIEREILPRLSVGLCPLEDSPWTRGKSGYKIIQYMAAGKPALASPVGIAADLVEDGATGFHCQTPEDWYSRLMQLHTDPHLLAAQGALSRERAVTRYDSSIATAQLARIFEACARG